MTRTKRWRPRGARLMLALAAAAAAGTAARAQEIPAVPSPLRVEADLNGVNLVNGRIQMATPVLAVPGAPNLRFDRVQNSAPYVNGTITTPTGSEHDERTYSVHTGTGTSDSFQCYDGECTSVTGSGSTIVWNTRLYQQAGSGAVYTFGLKHVSTPSPNQTLRYYASHAAYPDGETVSYSYQTATLNGDLFPGRLFYRPVTVTSSRGYAISITYQGNDFNGDPTAWGSPLVVTIYNSGAPATPLGRLTYSGDTITDLGGRVYTCQGCNNLLGMDIETAAGSTRLPGETPPAVQVAALPAAPLVASVTRDGVSWTYAYAGLRLSSGQYLYDTLTVAGPNGYGNVYGVDQLVPYGTPSQRNVIASVTDSIGRSTSYTYDPSFRPIRAVFPEGNEVLVAYDLYGNITSRISRAKPGSGLADITETAGYPAFPCTGGVLCSRPLWSRDALGRQTDYVHDSQGQLTERADPADANGVRRKTCTKYEPVAPRRRIAVWISSLTACEQTPPAIRTEYEYWGSTSLPLVERRIDASQGTTVTLDTRYTYDLAGRVLSVDGPLAGSADTVYNRYDVHGRKTWEIGALAPGGLHNATRTAYRDSDDKPLYTETGTLPNASSTNLTVLSRVDLDYDPRRNPIRETLSASGTAYGVMQRTFDDRGRLDCEARRMNPAAFGALPASACTLGTQGSQGADRITHNLYDNASQLLQVQRAYGTPLEQNYATYTYSPNGRRTSVTDGNGNRAEMIWDGHDRQRRWIFPSAATGVPVQCGANPCDYEEYSYDANGNRTNLRKRDGRNIAFVYDKLNRVTSKTYPQGGATPVYYNYDLRGLQLSARFNSQSGEGVTNGYDGFARLVSHSINLGGVTRTLTYQYDAAGNRTRITHPDATFFSTDYDALGRPWRTREPDNDPIATMSYDAQGRPSALGFLGGSGASYGYDGVSRLSALAHDLSGTSHDAAWTYAYNPASQIGSVTRTNDYYAWTNHYAVNRPYTADGLNRYSAAGSATFTYDANGNLTADGTRIYAYDIENRLVGASGGLVLTYDPLGRLHQSSGGASGTTRYLYDGDALVVEYDGANVLQRRYVHGRGADVPLVWYEGANIRRYLHADHQGSIVAVGQAYAAPYAVNRYDEYGVPASTNLGRFQYTGQAWLPDLGMYHYKARVYSPTLGRFMQTDPIGYDDQINLYAYVGNDPVNYTDPDGMQMFGDPRQYVVEAVGDFLFGDIRAAYNEPSFRNIAVAGVTSAPPGKVVGALVRAGRFLQRIAGPAQRVQRAVRPPTGIVYRRTNPNTNRCYIGRCNSEELYARRQRDHDRALDARHEYEVLEENLEVGRPLREAEQRQIQAHGGPTNRRNPNGGTENRRNEIAPCKGTRIGNNETGSIC